jgi:hypothetical protein
MPKSKEKNEVPKDEAIMNLLMIGLLKDDVDPAVISAATGIPEKTIRNRFPMKQIKRED